MSQKIYTAITFAPVQGFIEKSRKLRDLYGSSLLLSFLAEVICRGAKQKNHRLVSPALVNNAKGTPNQIIVRGQYSDVPTLFTKTWKMIVDTCQTAIEQEYLPNESYCWHRAWQAWGNYTWEFFSATGETINDARKNVSEHKRQRDWTGINWQGESSSLSGVDGVAWPGMDRMNPNQNYDHEINQFWQKLAQALPDSIIDIGDENETGQGEKLSIPELIKRLILLDHVKNQINQKIHNLIINQPPSIQKPPSFKELNRRENKEWTGWFMGDGDKMGEYLTEIGDNGEQLYQFSRRLIEWGKALEKELDALKITEVDHRIVYAGGDDFFGILSARENTESFKPQYCLPLLYQLHDRLWVEKLSNSLKNEFNLQRDLTPSVGFVWAAPSVPQRDVLQHCRETEKLAKNNGRDRLAIRILFNSGNHLDWHCPWWFLKDLLESYRDRDGQKIGHIFIMM
ncbi:MAG: type III-B CRISPR-associated protein Cas10/Cmr2 [Snowella sp.]|nr:type III-B CRISPR-associated protein Cas10/Cmr2 [Snowella sp.]